MVRHKENSNENAKEYGLCEKEEAGLSLRWIAVAHVDKSANKAYDDQHSHHIVGIAKNLIRAFFFDDVGCHFGLPFHGVLQSLLLVPSTLNNLVVICFLHIINSN